MDFVEQETLDFARAHRNEDTARLLLSASRYPHIDMRAAVQQIEGLRTAAEKWPSLLEHPDYLFPPHLNREQSSSDDTARYRAEHLVPVGSAVADLTGGMGIDTLWMARRAASVTYIEQDATLYALMQHNLQVLGVDNVTCQQADSMAWLQQQQHYDLLYIDPARRKQGQRTHAFEDCTPNLLENLDLLRTHSERLVVKASPMIDLRLAAQQLGCVEEIWVLAVKGECKEVVFLCGEPQGDPLIRCVSLTSRTSTFTFTWSEERDAAGRCCNKVGGYLYEPHAALMKGGAYKLIAQRYDLAQLDPNSHLYTGDDWRADFPGRQFKILQEVKLDKKSVAPLLPEQMAHVVTRNYPVAAADLQRKLGLREGGDRYLLATTVAGQRRGFLCERLEA